MNKFVLLLICVLLLMGMMFVRRKMYDVSVIKIPLLAVCVCALGLLGTYILYYFENGKWYGMSFFGAVLFFPILLLPLVWIFRISLIKLLSYATIPGMALLAVFKYNCYCQGCCGGITLWFTQEGVPVHFPSQIVEMGVALAIAALLLVLEKNELHRRNIYPLCLVIYGVARFILNWFRWESSDFWMGFAMGHLWSIISIVIGSLWLGVVYFLKDKRQNN